MAEQNVPNVGHLIEGHGLRDAIHVAVAPVTANHDMWPGTRCGFLEDGTVGEEADDKIGIVDPFLPDKVKPGDRFWMFLLPGAVTGMRHQWQHPAFKTVVLKQGGD